ncbi:MAG: DUF5130 family protein [Longispora sp.]|nr:DUF5130 family protein [Longispora sp. (in: high G+C Gram-positive bacteria)]
MASGDLAVKTDNDPHYPEVLNGPFTTRQLIRIDEALRAAEQEGGLTFSVYVGDLHVPVRGAAERLHGQLAEPDDSVLIAMSPNQRMLEIVTGENARKRLADRDCALAAFSMTAAFTGGDLTAGIVTGLTQLGTHARR